MDTGFDPSHPALAGKWRGGTNSWMDIINNIGTPYDDHGHGTHTIGTMVGGDGPGPFPDDVGLAYNAKFISAKVLDATNSFSTASIVIGGAQWMLNPDQNPNTDDFPHVINNSWYFSDPATTIFYGTASTWRAAGIIPVFCNGNEGPLPRTVMAPASYNNTLGIGATTSTDTIAPFSSRGPTLPGTSYPGDLVRSSLPGGFYSEWSGTSMAAPHVAGAIALMLQRHSSLTFDEIRTELRSSAVDRGLPGFDNDFGYGRLDVRAAVVLALTGVEDGGVTAAAPVVAAPNPFRDRVRFALNGAAPRSIEVFDLAGRRVWSATTQGGGALEWDGRDAYGRAVPAGVFLMRSSDGHTATTARILRVR
jgi:subtilisin family serine protease